MGTVVAIRDSLYNFVMGLGTSRDSRTASVYNFVPMARDQLEAAFRSDWIARKIVLAPAEDATREWREWQASNKQIEAIENYEKKLHLQQKLKRAVMLARLYGGSALVMGVPIGRAEEELDYEDVGLDDLRFVEAFHQFELVPHRRVTDVESPWFGRPEYYTIGTDIVNVEQRTPHPGVRIHPSRVIPFVGAEIPDMRLDQSVWGDSVLQAVDEAIKSAGHVFGGIASMVVDAKLDIINVPGLTKKLSDPVAGPALLARFQLANQSKSSINALLLDEKEQWNRRQTSFGSMPQLMQEYIKLAAGAASIPVSRLVGGAKGGLGAGESGGETDVRNYYDGISSEQRNEMSPTMSPLDEVLIRASTGSNDSSIHYDWRPLWQKSDTEKADEAKKKAETTKIHVDTGLINPDVLRRVSVNQLIEDGTYPGIEDAVDEFGEEPDEPEVTEDDVVAHIGMMQTSAGTLNKLAGPAQKALAAPKKPPTE
jgi:phage-related protein (TIGR01555 family)